MFVIDNMANTLIMLALVAFLFWGMVQVAVKDNEK